jgi:glycosyltransferase involved in cell wall biosynthesis
MTALPSAPFTVVVCTRDRTAHLAECLAALLELDYEGHEILVVDNAPKDDSTARLVQGMPVRYVCEPRPGLDVARNRGLRAARHDLIAFTDDDARVDRLWLRALSRAFADPEVAGVSGMVAPLELETRAQVLFERVYGGMGHGMQRRAIRRSALSAKELLWASGWGVGANMAFRRSLLERVGDFDPALDVGTPSGGCGDVEMFHRIVALGHTFVYEPDALVRHAHRRTEAELRRQLFDNGRGFGCYLLTCLRRGTVGWRAVLAFCAREWIGAWLLARLLRPNGMPRNLVLVELAGALVSPFAYVSSRRLASEGAS